MHRLLYAINNTDEQWMYYTAKRKFLEVLLASENIKERTDFTGQFSSAS
jgi:hypothetical protein